MSPYTVRERVNRRAADLTSCSWKGRRRWATRLPCGLARAWPTRSSRSLEWTTTWPLVEDPDQSEPEPASASRPRLGKQPGGDLSVEAEDLAGHSEKARTDGRMTVFVDESGRQPDASKTNPPYSVVESESSGGAPVLQSVWCRSCRRVRLTYGYSFRSRGREVAPANSFHGPATKCSVHRRQGSLSGRGRLR